MEDTDSSSSSSESQKAMEENERVKKGRVSGGGMEEGTSRNVRLKEENNDNIKTIYGQKKTKTKRNPKTKKNGKRKVGDNKPKKK